MTNFKADIFIDPRFFLSSASFLQSYAFSSVYEFVRHDYYYFSRKIMCVRLQVPPPYLLFFFLPYFGMPDF